MAADFTAVLIARTRAAVESAVEAEGFTVTDGNGENTFDVSFPDNTKVSVATNTGSLTVARVMPSGVVSALAEFTGFPSDMVIPAVVALVTEAY